MRAVLYATDFEPITVIELTPFAVEYLEKYGRVYIPVELPVSLIEWKETDRPQKSFHQVDIWAEKLRFPNGDHLMLFTKNEESAMMLKSVFLPGQRPALQEAKANAFAKGFLAAMQRLHT